MDIYTQTLASNISEELLISLLKLGAKACDNPFVTSKSYMLKVTLQKKFVTTICSFLSGLLVDDNRDSDFWQNFGNVLNYVLIILEDAMQFIPLTLWEHVQTVVKTITVVLPVILLKDKKITLIDGFETRITTLRENIIKIEKKFKKFEPTVTQNEENNENEEGDPEDDYRFVDVYPNNQELTVPERPFLRKNKVKGEYASLRQYLDIHFRLTREDFLNPIRQDICDYLNNTQRRLFNIKVHRNVVFLKKAVQRNIVCFEISLKISQPLQKMIETGQNKRLIHGTLLIFSNDNFKSIFCGKVMSNDNLKNDVLLVQLPYNDHIDYTKSYSMIECVIFFEPYYQVLKVLQRLSQNELPMEKYILKVETNTSHPKYMENVRHLKIPSGLNPSQIEAINAALNKEFVIIQGPPGTGKTFLGMTLVSMLLEQKEFWKESGPILVICYTNHALEQFLGGLSNFTDKIVRLGRNSYDLRLADLKFGPEGLLKTFLKTYLYNINHRFYSRYFLDNEHDIEEEYYSSNLPMDFESNFKRLVSYLRRYTTGVNYTIGAFYRIGPHSVPTKIMEWFRHKNLMSANFKEVKDTESEINETKFKIQTIFDNENDGILTIIITENNVEYHFEQIELFCWLLCDDGSVPFQQANKVDPPAKKGALEQESIYTLLCNFVLGSEDLIHGLSISELNQAAYELKTYLKTQNDLEQVDRRNLGEQLDFLLEKIDYLKYCLHTNFDPPEVEFDNFPDPFMIQSKHRWQLYKHWVEIYKDKLRGNLEKLCNHHERLYANYNDLKEMHNVKLLREMDVVGMTTTCAARLRSTIEALKSPIVIVEEAAEVLESHIVTALTKDCQQLILLGDHQQLRPATSDYTIEKKYKLGISLFERMVQNDVECHTLNVQHRMRPEISSLITPLFYKELFNHQSVKEYPLVSGIDLPLYFIDHIEPEEPYGDSSKMNTHEAKFLIQLAIYLLNNNYKAEDITILAAYLGQSYELKKEKDRSLHPNIGEVKIAVVDNFQGEENQIILLSLVRSNSENKVGFLSIDNRVCVALSRAKVGFYIMGNMTQLCEATDIWKSIRTSLESQKAIGRYLPLRCKNHKEHTTLVSKATDFLKVPEGGCNQACNATLECGHTCVKICHGNDVNHELYNCKEPCTRSLCYNEDHKCKKQCFEKCGGCHYLVNRKLPCGHEKNLACSTTVDFYECVEPVEMKPDCGHLQNIPCSLKTKIYKEQENSEIDSGQELNTDVVSFKCKVEIEKVISKCGHTQMVPCFEVGTFKCLFQIEITLKCGHKKEKLCYLEEEKVTCLVVCGKILGCGHKCMRKCHDDDPYHKRYKCTEPCTKNLSGCNNPEAHQKCQLICFQSCLPCKKPVMKSYISCSHIEKIECHKATETRGCHRPCSKKLACGHLCKNKCFELCSSCQQTTFKMIPECGHKIKVKCTEVPLQRYCKKQCSKTLECGHSCTRCCNESCNTVCNQQCQKKLDCGHRCIKRCHEDCACKIEVIPMCGHSITIKCGDELSSEKCKRSRNKRLDCGHTHFVPCNKPISSVICDEKSPRILACGHTQLGECSKSTADIKCYHSCEKLLECGHKCNKLCCEPCNKECQQRCNKKLECGHPCQARCSQPCTPLSKCLMPCEKLLKCNHKCDKRCYQPCTKICAETCDKKLHCGHTCSNTCGDECNVVCETRCGKKLDCGHHCHEFCGKPCVKVCRRSCKKTLQCGHRCNKKCFEACDTVCGAACGKLLRCGHACKQLCGQPCTQTCGRFCGKTLECGHLCKEKCGDLCTPLSQCKNPCEKTLSCGHDICTNLCNEPCTECFNKCIKKLDCGHMCINKCYEKCACSIVKSGDCAHYVRIKCGEIPTKLNCMQPCNKLLSCDHHCKQQCNEDCKCLESCRQRLKCGCMCIKFTCSEPCECRNGCFINENEE